jgi:PAS domain S-box-containing protein
MHRLLKRQLKQYLPNSEALPEEVIKFLEIVDQSYKDYDSDIEHLEHVLKVSSQELFIANKELNAINIQNEELIHHKTLHLKKTQFTLESAEKIARFCAINANLNDGSVEFSAQFKTFFPEHATPSSFDLKSFFGGFESSKMILDTINTVIKTNERLSVKSAFHNKNEKYFDIECEILFDSKKDSNLIIVLKDTTQNKLLEKEREEIFDSLTNYIYAINTSAIVSVADEKGIITNVNTAFCEISGYSKEELIGKTHFAVNSGYHDDDFFRRMHEEIYAGKTWKGVIRNKSKDGNFYWVDSTIVPFYRNGQIAQFISIRFDITDKINSAQTISNQRNFYESILNNIPIDIAVFNKDHQYQFVNPQAVKSEEVRQFLINKTDFDYCAHYKKDVEIARKRFAIFSEALTNLAPVEFTDELTAPDGRKSYLIRRFSPITDRHGEFWMMVGYGMDITERIVASNKMQESLQEKEALLGEIHHRVKNNLAIIVGLIEMQRMRSNNEALKNDMQIILGRINAVALIHEKLYKSQNFSKVNLADYIRDFAAITFSTFGKSDATKLDLQSDDISLTTKQAIPLALILNELLTNFLKYAVSDGRTSVFSVKIARKDLQIEVSMFDNGPGLPQEFDMQESKSLGFKLLLLFLKQLRAKYTISNTPGFTLQFEFQLAELSV